MAEQSASRSNERNKDQAIAARMRHLRDAKFTTEGFVGKPPPLAACRRMASANLRLIAAQKPTPSVSQ